MRAGGVDQLLAEVASQHDGVFARVRLVVQVGRTLAELQTGTVSGFHVDGRGRDDENGEPSSLQESVDVDSGVRTPRLRWSRKDDARFLKNLGIADPEKP